MHDKILILDFGSQVTQLIARRVREAHVYCEIHPNDVSDEFIKSFAPKGIILSGSHASTYEDHQLRAPQAVWDAGVPVLGICYGMQTMAVQLGGEVSWSDHREFGYAEVRAHGHTKLLDGIVRPPGAGEEAGEIATGPDVHRLQLDSALQEGERIGITTLAVETQPQIEGGANRGVVDFQRPPQEGFGAGVPFSTDLA